MFAVLISACGGNFTELNGTFTSPFFPNNYTNNLDCSFYISQPRDYRVTVSFLTLQLQEDDLCQFDFVQVNYFVLFVCVYVGVVGGCECTFVCVEESIKYKISIAFHFVETNLHPLLKS